MKNFSKNCNENPDIDNSYFHKKKKYMVYKCKNCVNENTKCLLCEKYNKKNSLTDHKKRNHTSVADSKNNDINNDVDIGNIINDDNDNYSSNVNRTLIVGPCFWGQIYLLMKKILLS